MTRAVARRHPISAAGRAPARHLRTRGHALSWTISDREAVCLLRYCCARIVLLTQTRSPGSPKKNHTEETTMQQPKPSAQTPCRAAAAQLAPRHCCPRQPWRNRRRSQRKPVKLVIAVPGSSAPTRWSRCWRPDFPKNWARRHRRKQGWGQRQHPVPMWWPRPNQVTAAVGRGLNAINYTI